MGTAPTMPPPPGGPPRGASSAFAGMWERFRNWPIPLQVVAWLLLWPLFLALLVMSGHAAGKGRPLAAVAILVATGPIWLAALTAGSSDPVLVEVAEVDDAAEAAREDSEPEDPTPEPEAPEPEPEEPEPAADPEPEPVPDAAAPAAASGDLEAYYFDVGQGDATLLKHADATVLIDTGRHQASDLVPYLRSVGVEALDLVVITHPHADHIGQFDTVIDAMPVSEVWWSGSTTTSQTFTRALAALDRSDAQYEQPRAGDVTAIGPLQVEVVNTPSGADLANLHDSPSSWLRQARP